MGKVGVLEVEAGCMRGPLGGRSLYRGYRGKSRVQAEEKGVGEGGEGREGRRGWASWPGSWEWSLKLWGVRNQLRPTPASG